ncbi:hypothetical protein EDD17DRAFT_1475401 [Pisolithus thermaeus]|nr:hypothetical protein EV401DRAFT_1865144 [Pisolithus croceorrhizus]KAI6164063.1 hypothetical protein EDD17DRAFT_1475401 [Pisolithus thermaeus]
MLTQLSSALNQPSPQGDSPSPSSNDENSKPDTEQFANTTKQETHERSDISPEAIQPSFASSPRSSPVPQSAVASPALSSSSHASPAATLSSLVHARTPEYVIWSRRPADPSSAPGIIISPRARPPDDIRRKALDLPSPFPARTPKALQQSSTAPQPEHIGVSSASAAETTRPELVDLSSAPATETTITAASSVTNTSVPTSPISMNTSISVAKSSRPSKISRDSATVRVTTPQTDSALLSSDPIVEPIPEPTPSAPSPAPSTSSLVSKPAIDPRPSFASLLRRDDTASSKRNALPRSSVVGISVPAFTPSLASSTSSMSPTQKPELLSLLMSGPSNSSSMKIYPRGLVNTGNMCFANAVLQVLVYCPPFWRLFHELGRVMGKASEMVADGEASQTPLVDATIRFLREFIPRQKKGMVPEGKGKAVDRTAYGEEEDVMESFVPAYVYNALKEKKRFDHMRGGHQEDAEEFLGFYLDTLEEELLSIMSSLQSKSVNGSTHLEEPQIESSAEDGPWLEVGKKNRTAVTRTVKMIESPITRIFGGKFRSTLRVPQQKDSIIFEDWRSLRLDIQRDQVHTIKDALSYISTPQSVQVTSVTKPGVVLEAKQIVQIETLPPILVLHLKRFLYDTSAGGTAKVGKHVLFGAELDIGSDVMTPVRKTQTTRYKLFGALYHHGTSASGGHYTLDVLHPNITMNSTKPREGWIRIDDELVSDVTPEDVFGSHARDDRCAYLLFYRRVSGGGAGVRT